MDMIINGDFRNDDYAKFVDYLEVKTPEVQARMAIYFRLVHASSKLASEAGELLDMIMKVIIYNKPFDQVNFIEELGDIEFYLQQLRNIREISRTQVLNANVSKLKTRYPNGFNEKDALNRNIEKERESMK